MDRVTDFESVSYKFETCMEYQAQLVIEHKCKAEHGIKIHPGTAIMLTSGKTTVQYMPQ